VAMGRRNFKRMPQDMEEALAVTQFQMSRVEEETGMILEDEHRASVLRTANEGYHKKWKRTGKKWSKPFRN
jgi:hypothetical protein